MEPNETTIANLGGDPPVPRPPETLSDDLYREYLTGYIIGRSDTQIGTINPNMSIVNLALTAIGLADAKADINPEPKDGVKSAFLNLGLSLPPQ